MRSTTGEVETKLHLLLTWDKYRRDQYFDEFNQLIPDCKEDNNKNNPIILIVLTLGDMVNKLKSQKVSVFL